MAVAFDRRYPGISVYEALVNKELSEEEKAKIIAEAIDSLSKEFPNLKDVATRGDIKETELKLIKEIEQTRKEIKELDVKIEKNKVELLKWVVALLFAQLFAIGGLFFGAVKFLLH